MDLAEFHDCIEEFERCLPLLQQPAAAVAAVAAPTAVVPAPAADAVSSGTQSHAALLCHAETQADSATTTVAADEEDKPTQSSRIIALEAEVESLRRQLDASLAVIRALEKENAVAHGVPVPASPDTTTEADVTPQRGREAPRHPLRVDMATVQSPSSLLMAPRGPREPDRSVEPPSRRTSSKSKVDSWNSMARPLTLFSRHQGVPVTKKTEAPSLHKPLRQALDVDTCKELPKSRGSSAAVSRSNSPMQPAGYRAPATTLQSAPAPRARVRFTQPSLVKAALAEFRAVHPGEDLTMERLGTTTTPSHQHHSPNSKVRIQRTALDV